MKPIFNSEPEIVFSAFHCPVCGEASGPKSNCFLNAEKMKSSIEDNPQNISLQLFTQNCLFRKDYIYQVDFNYPLVNALVLKIQNIAGVNKCVILCQSRLQIYIGPLYDPDSIIKQIRIVYRTFIKSLAATESYAIENGEISNFKPRKMAIIFPGGNCYEEYVTNRHDYIVFMNYYNEIANGVEGISLNDPLKKG